MDRQCSVGARKGKQKERERREIFIGVVKGNNDVKKGREREA